jgi:N-acetylmuramic acid 6-phosphate etherase
VSGRPPIFDEIAALPTEALNPRTAKIDEASTSRILEMINGEDLLVAPAVGRVLSQVAKAVEIVVGAIKNEGRVFYVGAGTSGRLGVVDAAECPPTFGTPPHLFQGIMAGGRGAVFRSKEGAEDRQAEARRVLGQRGVRARDVVIGLAACRRTPFVMAALARARQIGAKTIYVTCNPLSSPSSTSRDRERDGLGFSGPVADVVIAVEVGAEPIMGSTRMKCGTAEKMILNMISTASMIRLGKVYKNLMVDLLATSEKLRQRSIRIIMLATGCPYDEAVRMLARAGGSVKVAIVMKLRGVKRKQALGLLERSGGFVKRALKPKPSPPCVGGEAIGREEKHRIGWQHARPSSGGGRGTRRGPGAMMGRERR